MPRTLTRTYSERLSETLPSVRDRIAAASASCGRDVQDVRLVAVTKSHPFEAVEAALAAGLTDLGENRVEELEAKVEAFGRDTVTWHMIGHIQSRKAMRVARVGPVIHSVDSLKLAEKLSRGASEEGISVRVLAQVNTSGEASKSGLTGDSAMDEILSMAELPGLHIHGLMTMAPFVDDEGVLSRAFSALRTLSEEVRRANGSVGHELSMGMTNDMEVAIREGSTMVRIGTALFGARQ